MNGLTYQFTSVTNLAIRKRFFKKLSSGKSLSTYRQVQLSVKLEADELHDRLSKMEGFSTTRFDEEGSVLESDQDLIQVYCVKRKRYSTLHLRIWTSSSDRAADLRERLKKQMEDSILSDTVFSIDWHYDGGRMGVTSVLIDEVADDALSDDAYPTIEGGVGAFIDRYLDADQSVLVIHGPPGTGKTRLVRAMLAAMSRRAKDDCRIMFTGDNVLMQRDEIFMRFIGSGHQAFVIEDADHLLKPRHDGNDSLHRFLTISDGIVRAQGRKIIFTSNLPNLGDIDDALVRPGRCFACLTLPRLGGEDVEKLLSSINPDPDRVFAAREELYKTGAKAHSLAEIYESFASQRLVIA